MWLNTRILEGKVAFSGGYPFESKDDLKNGRQNVTLVGEQREKEYASCWNIYSVFT